MDIKEILLNLEQCQSQIKYLEEMIKKSKEEEKCFINKITYDDFKNLSTKKMLEVLNIIKCKLEREKFNNFYNIYCKKVLEENPNMPKAYHFPILDELIPLIGERKVIELDKLFSNRRKRRYNKEEIEEIISEKHYETVFNFLIEKEIIGNNYHYNCYCVNHDCHTEDNEYDGLWITQKEYNIAHKCLSLTQEEKKKMTDEEIENLFKDFHYFEIPCVLSEDENEITTLEQLENYDKIEIIRIMDIDTKYDELFKI